MGSRGRSACPSYVLACGEAPLVPLVSVVLVHPVLMLLLLFLKLTRGVTLTSVMVRKLLGVGVGVSRGGEI